MCNGKEEDLDVLQNVNELFVLLLLLSLFVVVFVVCTRKGG